MTSPEAPITVAIVEDDRATRANLATLLGREPKVRCLDSYSTGEAAIRGILAETPDIALVDINLPGMSGIDCVSQLKARLPELQVLMLTTYEESDLIFNSLRAGASGYLLKKLITVELIQAIEQVRAGGSPMSMQIARKVVDYFHRSKPPVTSAAKLTPREQDVLVLLAKGCLYKEIGDKLGIGVTTVRTHLKHLYEKLHVQSRTEATIKFLERE